MKKSLYLFILLCCQLTIAQLRITARKDNDETCLNNGAISWQVSNVLPGATITYNIINAQNKQIVISLSKKSFSGLSAGTYIVQANQTLGNNVQQVNSSNIYITNKIIRPEYTLNTTDEICGSDGKISINVTSGRGPYSYELLTNDPTPVLIKRQTSSIFTDLKAGSYKIRVVDACGTGLVKDAILKKQTSRPIFNINYSWIEGCGIHFRPYLNGVFSKENASITMEYTDSVTNELVKETHPYNNGIIDDNHFNLRNASADKDNLVKFTVIDGCGNSTSSTIPARIPPNRYNIISQTDYSSSCGAKNIVISNRNLFKVKMISAPDGFPLPEETKYLISTQFTHPNGMPAGEYIFELTDVCGRKETKTYTHTNNVINNELTAFVNYPCNDILTVNFNPIYPNKLKEIKITAAPQYFIDRFGALPYTMKVTNGSSNSISRVNVGDTFTVEYTTTCDPTQRTQTITVPSINKPDSNLPNLNIVPLCGSKIRVTSDRYLGYSTFYLQKYYPETGLWGIPEKQREFNPKNNNDINQIAFPIPNTSLGQSTKPNTPEEIDLPYGNGTYRILRLGYNYYTDDDGTPTYCTPEVVTTFDYKQDLEFTDAYSFQCSNGAYDIAIAARGKNLRYSIVSDDTNNATIIKNNGTNPIFHALPMDTYFLRITDECGNFITRKYDLATLDKPSAQVVADCTTRSIKLELNGLNYLNFQWRKTHHPDGSPIENPGIIATTSTLDLGTYEPTEAGTYSIRIFTDPTEEYCIDYTTNVQLTEDPLTAPKAGNGQHIRIKYDGSNPQINLFDYLKGTYDSSGEWTEVNGKSSNLLKNNLWNAYAAIPGTYQFRYTVKPLCKGKTDTSEITVEFSKICYKLPNLGQEGDRLPSPFGITAQGRAGVDADNWPMIRQGGWMVLEANSKGFVLNRVAFDENNLPVGIPQKNFVAGMVVFDTTNKCIKIYNGNVWRCYQTQTCPE